MRDFYKPEEHGPFQTVPMHTHLCALGGNYVLCPSLRLTGAAAECSLFGCGLREGWTSTLLGLMASPRPVTVPRRCDACKKAGTEIRLVVQRTEESKDDATDQDTPEDPESASSEE